LWVVGVDVLELDDFPPQPATAMVEAATAVSVSMAASDFRVVCLALIG